MFSRRRDNQAIVEYKVKMRCYNAYISATVATVAVLPVKQGGKRKVTPILIMSAFNQSADLVQMDQSDWGQKGVKISSSQKYRMKKYTKYFSTS